MKRPLDTSVKFILSYDLQSGHIFNEKSLVAMDAVNDVTYVFPQKVLFTRVGITLFIT